MAFEQPPWSEPTQALVFETGNEEQGGRSAALERFGEGGKVLYFSAAVTIEAFLVACA
jgi:hypothetical protein